MTKAVAFFFFLSWLSRCAPQAAPGPALADEVEARESPGVVVCATFEMSCRGDEEVLLHFLDDEDEEDDMMEKWR